MQYNINIRGKIAVRENYDCYTMLNLCSLLSLYSQSMTGPIFIHNFVFFICQPIDRSTSGGMLEKILSLCFQAHMILLIYKQMA